MEVCWKRVIPRTLWITLPLTYMMSGSGLLGQTILQRASPMGTVSFSKVVTLGDQTGPGLIGMPGDVKRRQNGEWVLTDQILQSEVKEYSSDGTWLRKIGRNGEGPGEFRWAAITKINQDDGLAIYDPRLGRVTSFDSSLEVMGTSRGPDVSLLGCVHSRGQSGYRRAIEWGPGDWPAAPLVGLGRERKAVVWGRSSNSKLEQQS